MDFQEKLTEAVNDCGCCDDDMSLEAIPDDANWDHLELRTEAAEYKGRKVTLNKPFRTPNESKKFAVYVKKGDRVVIVRFGDPNMEIKRDDPDRRRAFKARHNCDKKTDKTTPGWWSCNYSW